MFLVNIVGELQPDIPTEVVSSGRTQYNMHSNLGSRLKTVKKLPPKLSDPKPEIITVNPQRKLKWLKELNMQARQDKTMKTRQDNEDKTIKTRQVKSRQVKTMKTRQVKTMKAKTGQ
jgi:hypothetical protein